MITCKSCNIKKDNSNFYVKDRLTGRLSNKCKICEAKEAGIKDIGKLAISKENLDNGKRKCCDYTFFVVHNCCTVSLYCGRKTRILILKRL